MMAERPSGQRRRVSEIFRWRGAFLFLVLAVREFLGPDVYWHVFYIFETDVAQQPLPAAYSQEMTEARVYTRQMNTDKAQAEVVALGELNRDEISRRLDRGDALASVYIAEEPAGYGWLSLSSGCMDLAFGFTWIVRPHEAVKYGNFVHPKSRRRGIQSSVNAYARDIGICRTLASISTLNTQSMSLARHYRKASTMNVTLVQFRAIHWTISRASGSPFESRFARPA
jgi:hypothetical protein